MAHDLRMIFGELRACLAAPSEDAWRRLCRLIDAQPVTGELVRVVLPYVSDQLDATWPDSLRRAPTAWLEHERRRLLSPIWVHASLYDEDFYYGDGVMAFQEYAPWWAADAEWTDAPADHAWARDAGIFALLDGGGPGSMATLDLFDLDQRRVSAKITGPPWATGGKCALSDGAGRALVLWVGQGRASLHSSDLSPRLSGKRISWEHSIERDIVRHAGGSTTAGVGASLCVPGGVASWVACSMDTWLSIRSAHTGATISSMDTEAPVADLASATVGGERVLLVLDHEGNVCAWRGLPDTPELVGGARAFGARYVLQSDDGTIWTVADGEARAWGLDDGGLALREVYAHADISTGAVWCPCARGIRGVFGMDQGGVRIFDVPSKRSASLVINKHARLLALSSRGEFAILGDHTEVHLVQLDCAMARAKASP